MAAVSNQKLSRTVANAHKPQEIKAINKPNKNVLRRPHKRWCLATNGLAIAPPATKAAIGSVAIQPKGASCKPTNPLIATKVTLLVRNKPWHKNSNKKLRLKTLEIII